MSINANELGWEDGQKLVDLIDRSEEYFITDHMLIISLPAWSGIWLG